jgi:hypothetical protein
MTGNVGQYIIMDREEAAYFPCGDENMVPSPDGGAVAFVGEQPFLQMVLACRAERLVRGQVADFSCLPPGPARDEALRQANNRFSAGRRMLEMLGVEDA